MLDNVFTTNGKQCGHYFALVSPAKLYYKAIMIQYLKQAHIRPCCDLLEDKFN